MTKKCYSSMLEASRCSAMAAHAAAGIVVTNLPLLPGVKHRLKEAERLLRGAESMARLATSLLQTLANGNASAEPCSVGSADVGGGEREAAPKVSRRRKQKKRDKADDQVMDSADVLVGGLSPPLVRDVAVVPVAASGGGTHPRRSLQYRVSRERSPRGGDAQSGSASAATTDGLDMFGVGAVIVLRGLQARPELNGKTGKVTSLDRDSGRYAVRIGQESLRVKGANMTVSIFGDVGNAKA